MKAMESQGTPNVSNSSEAMPPHGFKGTLESSSVVTPQDLIGLAFGVLVLAFVFVLIMKLRERFISKKSSSYRQDEVAAQGAWSALRAEVDAICAPESDFPSESVRFRIWGDFTSSVSLCLRRALELRTGLPLAESTTEEILKLLRKSELLVTAISSAELEVLLSRLDAIRFAGVPGSSEEAQELLRKLKDAIAGLEPSPTGDLSDNSSGQKSKTVADKDGLKEAVRVFE